ncbi:MAG: hypothetical protein KA319_14135 [Ferruginibacter sp.]|nr:hypothetical protein [Ferruginibacter sp.]
MEDMLFDNNGSEIKNIKSCEFYINGELFNIVNNGIKTAEFKAKNFLAINDGNKREVFAIVKSRMNFKSLISND